MDVSWQTRRISLGVSLKVVLNLHQPRLDTLHDGQRDMNVLVRLDVWIHVREPVLKDGGKLDLLEHVARLAPWGPPRVLTVLVSSPALLRTS